MAARIVSTSLVLFLFINKINKVNARFSDYLPDYEGDSETELDTDINREQKPDKLPEILPVCHRWGITDPDNEETPNINTSPCPENITSPDTPGITACCRQWLIWFEELKPVNFKNVYKKDGNGYAKSICDSWGVRESGYLEGNFRGEGRFYECTRAVRDPNEYRTDYPDEISGKYCEVYRTGDEDFDTEKREYQTHSRQYGVCVPSACTEKDFPFMSVNVNNQTHSRGKCVEPLKVTTSSIICIIFLAIIGSTVLFSTFMDLFFGEFFKQKVEMGSVFWTTTSYFSMTRNTTALVTFKSKSKRSSIVINCLNGLKAGSLFWVIAGHTALHVGTEFVDNLSVVVSWQKSRMFLFITTFCVDSFFTVSGLLTCYLTLKQLHGKKRLMFNVMFWLQFYLHRYLRLVPAMAGMIIFMIGVYPYIGQGPVWVPLASAKYEACVKNWWTNILFINNIYPTTGTDGCIPWTWYLANDWQFFLVTPIFLILYLINWKVGVSVVSACIVGSSVLTGWLSKHYYGYLLGISPPWYHLSVPERETVYGSKDAKWDSDTIYSDVYTKPWCRINAYLIGILGGFYFYQNRVVGTKLTKKLFWWLPQKGERSSSVQEFTKCVVWIVLTFLACWDVTAAQTTYNGDLFSANGAAAYQGLSRWLWSCYVLWIIVACEEGWAPALNNLLSSDLWLILGRLGYTGYLVQSAVIYYFFDSQPVQYHGDLVHLSFLFLSFIMMSYMNAYTLYMAVEAPFAILATKFEQVLTGKR